MLRADGLPSFKGEETMLKKFRVLAALAACSALGAAHAQNVRWGQYDGTLENVSESAWFSSTLSTVGPITGDATTGAKAQSSVTVDVYTGPQYGYQPETINFLASSYPDGTFQVSVTHGFAGNTFAVPYVAGSFDAAVKWNGSMTNTTDSVQRYWMIMAKPSYDSYTSNPVSTVSSNGTVLTPLDSPPATLPDSPPFSTYSLGELAPGQSVDISTALTTSAAMNAMLTTTYPENERVIFFYSETVSPVPESATAALMLAGLAGVVVASRRKRA